jgi:hypothetical protein
VGGACPEYRLTILINLAVIGALKLLDSQKGIKLLFIGFQESPNFKEGMRLI